MKLLLLESHPDLAATLKDELEQAGHEVATCSDADTGGPCRSVVSAGACPLATTYVDLAVVARRLHDADTLLEMGAVCAERHRSPVIHIDPTIPTVDVAGVVVRAAAAGKDRVEAAYSAAVRARLDRPGTLVQSVRGPDSVRIEVVLDPDDAADPGRRAWVADRARAAVREYDPFVRTIDVSCRVAG
jgi:hypothetical protein